MFDQLGEEHEREDDDLAYQIYRDRKVLPTDRRSYHAERKKGGESHDEKREGDDRRFFITPQSNVVAPEQRSGSSRIPPG